MYVRYGRNAHEKIVIINYNVPTKRNIRENKYSVKVVIHNMYEYIYILYYILNLFLYFSYYSLIYTFRNTSTEYKSHFHESEFYNIFNLF